MFYLSLTTLHENRLDTSSGFGGNLPVIPMYPAGWACK